MKKFLSIAFLVFMLFLIKTTSAQNYGLSFANSATYAQIPQDPSHNITGSITLEAWIYPTSWTSESWRGSIINKEQNNFTGYMLRCGANGTLSFNFGSGSAWKEITSPVNTLILNTWQHVAGVFNGTTLILYVNGVQVGTPVSFTGTIGTNSIPIEIGRSNIDVNRFFYGKIDEVRIWNSAISATDIFAYYNSSITSSNPNYASLVGYYEMDNFYTDSDNDGNLDITATVGVLGEVYTASYGPACNPLFSSSAPTGTTTINTSHSTIAPVSLGNTNVQVMKVIVDVFNDATLSQLVFRTNGTTSASDIANARVWYTGSNGSFSTSSQFGATVLAPPGANTNMIFTDTKSLSCGRHYFWLTFDIQPTATISNVVDATFQSATIDGSSIVSLDPNPSGSREILSSCAHTIRMTASTGTLGWNGAQVDVYVNGVLTMSGIGANFLTGAGPKDTLLYASTSDTITIVRVLDGATVANVRVALLDGNGTVKIAAIQPTTTGIGTRGYCGGIVTTGNATLITDQTAQLNGTFSNCFPTETGFRYKKTTESVWNLVQDNDNPLTYVVQGLSAQTQYHYQAYAIVGSETIYGSTVTFTTACGAITSVPWTDYFDTYGTGSTVFPSCWVKNSTASTYPYVYSTYYASSPGSLYFYAGSVGGRIMAVSPMFDSSIPINTLKAEFKIRASATDDTLIVGVMTDPADYTTFVPVSTISLTTTSTFQDREVFFNNYTGTGQYIAFRVNYGPTTSTMFLDNVEIMTIPTCPRPTNVVFSGILANSANVSWTESGTATEWEIEYGPSGFALGTGTVISNITSLPYTIQGLNPQTNYQVYVKAICSTSDISLNTNPVSFMTACAAITTLPYVENFDSFGTGSTVYHPCWFRNSTTATYPYISSSYYTSSPGSLYFYAGSSGNRIMAITPLFDASIPINTLKTEFKMRVSGTDDSLIVGVMSDPTDLTTFTVVATLGCPTTNTFTDKEVFFTNYTGTGQYIAYRVNYGASSAAIYFDNVNIMTIPACPRPTNPSVTNIANVSADLTWTENGSATQWEVEYGPVGFTQGTGTIVSATSNPFPLYGLTQATEYTYYVRAVCAPGNESIWSVAYNFATNCDPIITLPFIDDFESTTVGTIPLCYDSIASNSGEIKVLNNATYGKVLEMSFTSSTGNCMIVLPQINFPINTLRLSFKFFSGPVSHSFGYVTNPSDPSTFVELLTQEIPNSTGEWYHFDLLTNNTLTGNERIAIRYNGLIWYNSRYDSLTVDLMPSCLPPFALTSSAITTTDATVSWSPAGTGTPVDYTLQYRALGETTWNVINNVTPPYILNSLNSSTTYQYQVQANCGNGDLSDWSSIASFMTACGSITTLPWSDAFDTYGTGSTIFPTCWTKTQLGSNSLYVTTTNASAPGSLYSYISTSGNYNIAITPQFDASIPINTLKANYKYYASGSDDTLYIGVMSIATDASTFELVAKRIPTSTGSFQDGEVYFNNYTGIGQYIAFKTAYVASSSTSYLDNVVVSTIPACPTPSFLTSSNISTYSADLAWTENGTATAWAVEYGLTGFTPGTGTIVTGVSTNPYTLQGLSPNTTYQVYVMSDCGGIYSSTSNVTTFTTALIPITLPYYNDFENPSTYPDFGFVNGTQVNKFVIGSAAGVNNTVSGANALYISNDNGTSWAYTGGTTNASRVYSFVDIQVPVGVNELLLDFDWIAQGSSATNEFLRVYLMPVNIPVTAGNIPPTVNSVNYDLAAMIGRYTGGPGDHWLSVHNTWQHAQFSINTIQYPNLAGNTWRLYFHWRNDQATAVQPPATVDNISITIPTCPTPTALVTSNILTNSVDLTWTENGSATSWNIEYGPTGFTPGTGTMLNGVTTNPYTISGLSPQTTYQIYVTSVCGSSDLSARSIPKTVITACGAITTLPWTDFFDTYGTGSGIFPQCWTKNTTNTTYPYITSTNFSSPGSMYFYNGTAGNYSIAATPLFDATIPVNTLKAEFKYRTTYSTDTIYVGVMTDPTIASTFVQVASIGASATGTWQDKEVFFSSYTGSGQYIAFKNQYNTTYTYSYLDNLTIMTIPTCPRPNNLSVSNITSSSVDLNWVENGSATQWEIEFGLAGFTQGTGTYINSTTHPTTIPLLAPSTMYDFYVRAICGAGDTSIWSVKQVATTACVAITSLPWNEGFESITAATQLPSCWAATSFGTYTNTQISDYGSYNRNARTGTRAAYFKWSCNDRFFTPGFQLTAGQTYQFSYWYITDGASGWTSLDLGVYSAQTAGNLIQTINSIPSPTNTTYTQVNATFIPTVDGVYYFGVYTQANATPWYITLDDFSLTSSSTPTCTTPTNLAVSAITSSGATASWTAGGTETQWEVAYKPTASSTWNSIFVTNPTHNFTTLTASTPYDVKVRAICSPGDTSAYTAVVNFTTTAVAACNTPTGLAVSNNTNGSATINWVNGGTETAWELDYKLSSSSTWTSLQVTSHPQILMGLNTCSDYNVRVRAVCSAGVYSSYTSVVNFTTPPVTPTNVQVPTVSITDQSAVVTWTPGGSETQWQVEYKLTSSANWTTPAPCSSSTFLLTPLQSNSTYQVRVKALCGANSSAFTNSVQFTTNGASVFTITASSNSFGTISPSGTVTVNAGANQLFTFTPNANATIDSLIIDNGAPIAHTLSTYTFSNVISNHTIVAIFKDHTGVEESVLNQMVDLYPNPTNSYIDLRFDEAQLQVKECRLYDIYGKLLKVVLVNSDITRIDVSDIANGVYFVRIDSERGTITKKFVKE
jgi:hypothetical protein